MFCLVVLESMLVGKYVVRIQTVAAMYTGPCEIQLFLNWKRLFLQQGYWHVSFDSLLRQVCGLISYKSNYWTYCCLIGLKI